MYRTDVPRSQLQHFSMFVDVVRTLNPGEALCLECVLNPQLRAWCRGHGWIEEPKEHARSFTNPSFYWVKEGAQGIGSVEAWYAGQEENGKRGLNWDTWTLRELRSYEEWRARRRNRPVLQVEPGRVSGEE
ncbi:hypothetical protein [Ktedonobacter sp. SOSP1-52]|uniref:hypothetical protein n=1 Tax=Ktedonobacter sp. SOSP1-52 TaxID=2778366 RepID=UPI0019162B4A|nr:hypothetical protein [Ktedonobacter sp. SOSP1-52]